MLAITAQAEDLTVELLRNEATGYVRMQARLTTPDFGTSLTDCL